jgi:YVTN family beta-propeller protein
VKTAALSLIVACCLSAACDSSLYFSTSRYTVGGTVSGLTGSGLVIENLSAGTNSRSLDVSSNGSFVFGTRVASGTAYSVTVVSQPDNPAQTCTVSNGSGTVAQSDVANVVVSCMQTGRFAYVANQLSGTISAYVLNSSTGALTQVTGSPFVSGGSRPQTVSVAPGGSFLYVANSGSNDLSVFSITDTGVLNPLARVATGESPYGIAVNPSNTYLYVSNFASNNVSAYAIAAGGVLTEIPGSPFAVGSAPTSLRTDPMGNFLYVANSGSGTVSVLRINASSGALATVTGSPFAAGRGATSIAIDATGTFAYVANAVAATISEYSIDASTGALSAISTSPLAAPASPTSLTADSASGHLYVTDTSSTDGVAAFAIDATSGVLALSGTTQTGTDPVDVAIDPSNRFVYIVCNGTNDVYVYSIAAASGALTPAAPAFISAGAGPTSIALD